MDERSPLRVEELAVRDMSGPLHGHLARAPSDDVLVAFAAALRVVGRSEPIRDPLDLFEEGEFETLRLPDQPRVSSGQGLSHQNDTFALRVRGDSMVEDGILDGDDEVIGGAPGGGLGRAGAREGRRRAARGRARGIATAAGEALSANLASSILTELRGAAPAAG